MFNHLLWLQYYHPAETSVTCSGFTMIIKQKPQSLALAAIITSTRNHSHFYGCTSFLQKKDPQALALAALNIIYQKPEKPALAAILSSSRYLSICSGYSPISSRNVSHFLWLHHYHPAETSVNCSGCNTIIQQKPKPVKGLQLNSDAK